MRKDTRSFERRVPFAVFVSGEGTNLQALYDAMAGDEDFPGQIALVVSDKPECYGVARARAAGIPVFANDVKQFSSRAAFETEVLKALQSRGVEWIALAGYMRLIGATLLEAYPQRIVNIHPSLLPMFPGRHPIRDALDAGARETGVTVHYVDDGIDTGKVIAQEAIDVQPGMTVEDVHKRIQEVEHRLYPQVLRELLRTKH